MGLQVKAREVTRRQPTCRRLERDVCNRGYGGLNAIEPLLRVMKDHRRTIYYDECIIDTRAGGVEERTERKSIRGV